MKGSQESLTTVVVKSWPTPAARDHKDAGDNVDMEKVAAKSKLSGVVAMHGHPVPASSNTDGSRREFAKLNARWCETLMGLPVGWTMPSCASPVTIELMNCASSETESCQQPQKGPSEC
jgi:hypothetical protein